MQRKLSNTAGLIAFGAAVSAMLAAPASAQVSTTANGPYYATPSWDQKLTTNRFVILANWNNEAVLDRETGLVWERSPGSAQTFWFDAKQYCNNRVVGSRRGWRVPGVQELASLVDPAVADPALPAGHPFTNVQGSVYWSATLLPAIRDSAWSVSFDNGNTAGSQLLTLNYVWCVRGGQGPDAQ
jgi:uncharacterized protein DUF1566